MALSEEENLYRLIIFDDWCLEEWIDAEKRILFMDFDDSKSDKGCEDIVHLLPSDPFGMEFDIEATFEAINDWIEDFGLKAYGYDTDEAAQECSNDANSLKAAEDDDDWSDSEEYKQEDWDNKEVDADSMMYSGDCSYDYLMCFGCEKYEIEQVKNVSDGDSVAATDTIIFVLGYLNLNVKVILSVERVCKSLRDAVRKDPYLWTKIHIDDSPLSLKINNDDLLWLTDKAQGKLRSLTLVNCPNITHDGLKQVLERNLELTKLSVVGSIKLSVEGVLHNLKFFNSVALPGIKRLRIGESIGITNENLKEFKLLLGADEDAKPNKYKPRFYRGGEKHLSLDDDRAIDIETCPRCQKLRQVYDCPTENCQVQTHSTKICRACIFCIARCIRCGCCLDNKAYEETFCFDLLCFDCLQEFFNCPDGVMLTAEQTDFHQMAGYHVFLYS